MKTTISLLFVFLWVSNLAFGQTSTDFEPKKPSPGQNIVIKLNSKSELDSLWCYVYHKEEGKDLYVKTHLALKTNENTYQVEVPSYGSTTAIFYVFRLKGEVFHAQHDNSILFYKGDQLVPNARATLASYLIRMNAHILNWDYDNAKAHALFKEEFSLHPSQKRENYLRYLYSFNLNDSRQKTELENELETYQLVNDLNATEYAQIYMFYGNLGLQEKAAVFRDKYYEKYPDDRLAVFNQFSKYSSEFNNTEVYKRKLEIYKKFDDDFNNRVSEEGRTSVNNCKAFMLGSLLFQSYENNNLAFWQSEVDKLNAEQKIIGYYLGAGEFLRKKKYLKEGLDFARIAKDLGAGNLLSERTWREPTYLTDEKVMHHRKVKYADNAGQYGKFLLANYKIDSALHYLRLAAIHLANFESQDLNRTLVENLIKYGEKEEAGRYTELIIKNQKSDPIIDAMAGKIKAESPTFTPNVEGKLIEEELAFFKFKNVKNKVVEKKDLRGKIVVLDFWATWCGPCIMKFYPLYNLQKKYADIKEVQFLYINTLEEDPNSKENALELLKEKGFDFEVLFDKELNVKHKLGISKIPTLLILDKNSKIRYVEVGYDTEKGTRAIENAIEQLRQL